MNNHHIRRSARLLNTTLAVLSALGLTVARASIGSRNPRITLSAPPQWWQLKGYPRITRPGDAGPLRRQVTLIDGCQIEWEE